MGCERVVRAALLADRRLRLGREVLAARRSGTVCGEARGWRPASAAASRAETGTASRAERVRRDTRRAQEIGAAHVADEHGVAGEHAVGHGVVRSLAHDDADRLGRVPGRRQHLERDVPEPQLLAVAKGLDREVDVGALAVRDRGAGLGCELQMPAQEVGVDVRLDHPLDAQAVGVGVVEVDLDVAPRIDDHGPARVLVADEVRRLGKAVQVVLHEVHSVLLFVAVMGSGAAQLPLDRLHFAVQRVGGPGAVVDLDHDAHSR